jgi:CBS domain-containing protein
VEVAVKKRVMTKPVFEVMTPEPVKVRPDVTVEQLLALFDRHDFNAFPVVDEDGTLLGIVTKLDVLRFLRPDPALRIPDLQAVSGTHVRNIMRSGIVTVEPEDPIVVAADLMVETRLHSLPVVLRRAGEPTLAGMVSRGDLLRGLRLELLGGTPTRAVRAAAHAR